MGATGTKFTEMNAEKEALFQQFISNITVAPGVKDIHSASVPVFKAFLGEGAEVSRQDAKLMLYHILFSDSVEDFEERVKAAYKAACAKQ